MSQRSFSRSRCSCYFVGTIRYGECFLFNNYCEPLILLNHLVCYLYWYISRVAKKYSERVRRRGRAREKKKDERDIWGRQTTNKQTMWINTVRSETESNRITLHQFRRTLSTPAKIRNFSFRRINVILSNIDKGRKSSPIGTLSCRYVGCCSTLLHASQLDCIVDMEGQKRDTDCVVYKNICIRQRCHQITIERFSLNTR